MGPGAASRRRLTVEQINASGLVLTVEEARELECFTRHDYINPNTYPALIKLIERVSRFVQHAKHA